MKIYQIDCSARKKGSASRELAKKLLEKIKNSEVRIINNCGHMIIFEKAFEMRKIVKEFILKLKK